MAIERFYLQLSEDLREAAMHAEDEAIELVKDRKRQEAMEKLRQAEEDESTADKIRYELLPGILNLHAQLNIEQPPEELITRVAEKIAQAAIQTEKRPPREIISPVPTYAGELPGISPEFRDTADQSLNEVNEHTAGQDEEIGSPLQPEFPEIEEIPGLANRKRESAAYSRLRTTTPETPVTRSELAAHTYPDEQDKRYAKTRLAPTQARLQSDFLTPRQIKIVNPVSPEMRGQGQEARYYLEWDL